MTGDRYRMVTVQNGTEHVSSIVLGELEVANHISAEEEAHAAAGWQVERMRKFGELLPHLMCISPKGRVRRIYAKRFSAFEDAVRVDESPPPPRTAHTGEDT